MASEDHMHFVSTEGMSPGNNTMAQCNHTECDEEIIVQVPPQKPSDTSNE